MLNYCMKKPLVISTAKAGMESTPYFQRLAIPDLFRGIFVACQGTPQDPMDLIERGRLLKKMGVNSQSFPSHLVSAIVNIFTQ